jgi:DNA repair exonuclease SbcCD ATPase subunit
MESFNNMTVWELLSFLQSKVRKNAAFINEINKSAINSRKNAPNTPELLFQINELIKRNSELTNENSNLITLFNALHNLSKQYSAEFKQLQDIKNSHQKTRKVEGIKQNISEYLDKTLKGELPLNNAHPLVHEKWFLEELYEKCVNKEMYEMCKLIKHFAEE